MRRAKGLPSLRSERLLNILKGAIRQTRREGFRIVHYSVQADHLHMVVEAADCAALSSGMRSFSIRSAMRLNSRGLGRRRGRIWGDRHHRRAMKTPREVRNTLVYVLANHMKHGEKGAGLLDPCSSGPWFEGWLQALAPPSEASPAEPPATWLLREGWQRAWPGLIHLGEVPREARP